jgi:hypothetical protein
MPWLLAAGFALFLVVTPAHPADPLRLVPDVADLVVKVEQPRALVENFLELIPQKELQGFRGYREFYESTNYRRFLQLIGHFERELGKPWPQLVDELAGNGIALGLKFEKKAPALLVVEGKNPELTQRFVKLFLQVVEQELARQESKDKLERTTHQGVEVTKLGEGRWAVIGSTILLSNADAGIKLAIDLHKGGSPKSVLEKKALQDGRKLIGDGALAWAWVSLAEVKKDQNFKNLYDLPSSFFPFPLTIGGLTDTIRRSDYVTASLRRDHPRPPLGKGGSDVVLSIRMPAGKEGLHEALAGHAPPEGSPAIRPLLEPKDVLFSLSYYQDLAKFWEKRDQILPKDQLENIDKAEKNSGAFLFGNRIGDFFNCFGARHRLVAVRQAKTGYTVAPQNQIPAFALVLEMRDPDKFAKAIEPPLRSLALLLGTQVRLEPVEEMHGAHKIIGYRFAEQQKAGKIDTAYNGVLPNFSPCFVRVGEQFVFSSTLELAHTLIDELAKESKDSAIASDATVRGRFSWAGLSSFLAGNVDALTTQSILAEGSTPEEARQQVQLLLDLLQKLGSVEIGVDMLKDEYRLDLRARLGEKK